MNDFWIKGQSDDSGLTGQSDNSIEEFLEEQSGSSTEGQTEGSKEDLSDGDTGSTNEESEPESTTETAVWWKVWENDGFPVMWVAGGVLAAVLTALGIFAFLHTRRKKRMVQGERPQIPEAVNHKKAGAQKTEQPQKSGSIGKVHNIGGRKDQQDSFGVTSFAGGEFIVVADGMGGLSSGDKVSQKVVMTMLQDAAGLQRMPNDRILFELVAHANSEVNRMLGDSDHYTSGSTVVAAIVENNCFHWVSVGDSRIYLYRNNRLIQLNREHTYGAELLVQAVNGEVSFEEARSHPKRGGLTSFIGMGELRYVDGSLKGIQIQPGDRLLLMSDGVFHTLSEEEMQHIMEISDCAERAASVVQDRIVAYGKANQDNFTAVIIDL